MEENTPAKMPYEPTEREQRAIDVRKRRRDAAMPHPKFAVTNTQTGETSIHSEVVIDHEDSNVGWDVLVAGLGLSDHRAAGALIDQISAVAQQSDGVSQLKANQLLSVVQEIAPRDPIEALIAVQMATVHSAAMQQAASLNAALTLPGQYKKYEAHSNAFNKLTRTFTTQMEALKRYRSKAEQRVIVEHQHVHVYPGGQAVVGNVTQGGVTETEGQPHERQLRLSECNAVLGTIEADQAPVPGASGKGSVCRFHGARGGQTSGPSNSRYVHGQFTQEAIGQRVAVAALIKQCRETMAGLSK
ncbi:MAG: hypothetical protein ABS76_14350 [Pelagibacterium sp. SCN 64-44]|nr:MAG: hypothetical protein ABS76_14350 [Pelagibacterium sp. SCN 64-44]